MQMARQYKAIIQFKTLLPVFSLRIGTPPSPVFHPSSLFLPSYPVYRSSMPRPHPHPLALFSLLPQNERAEAVVRHPINNHLISTLDGGTLALDVGHIRSKSGDTLVTLGRGDADIFVEGSSIAKVQCSFEIDLHTHVVLFYDRSHGQTTQVYGKDATPLEYGRPRKVVVQANLNTLIGMGGEGRDLVQFKLVWYQNPVQTMEKVKDRKNISFGYEDNPRLARTIEDEADTVLPSRRVTRLHTPGPQQLKMRYVKIGGKLGSGQYGKVYKAVDVDSGKLMAVKTLEATKQQQEKWGRTVFRALKREVESLANIHHVSKTSKPLCFADELMNASHTLSIISRHNVGTESWRYSWV